MLAVAAVAFVVAVVVLPILFLLPFLPPLLPLILLLLLLMMLQLRVANTFLDAAVVCLKHLTLSGDGIQHQQIRVCGILG